MEKIEQRVINFYKVSSSFVEDKKSCKDAHRGNEKNNGKRKQISVFLIGEKRFPDVWVGQGIVKLKLWIVTTEYRILNS